MENDRMDDWFRMFEFLLATRVEKKLPSPLLLTYKGWLLVATGFVLFYRLKIESIIEKKKGRMNML